MLADNKLALNAGWDDDLFAAEVADLDALSFDLSLPGFADAEVGRLADLFQQGAASSFPTRPLPGRDTRHPPRRLLGLGEHRLLCGDALNPEDLSRALGGSLADVVFTDRPYNTAPA